MLIKLAVVLIAVSGLASAEVETAKDKFFRQTQDIRAEYRVAIGQSIRNAQRVDLFLLRFDGMEEKPPYGVNAYGGEYKEESLPRFEVAPYGTSTEIITKLKLDRAQSKVLLKSLADQVQKPKHTGGALCHFPVHGIRVYTGSKDENLVYSGTFCWKCSNFGFAYPEGSAWLDTSETLKKNMNSLLPIPLKELERFEKMFPSKRPIKAAETLKSDTE